MLLKVVLNKTNVKLKRTSLRRLLMNAWIDRQPGVMLFLIFPRLADKVIRIRNPTVR